MRHGWLLRSLIWVSHDSFTTTSAILYPCLPRQFVSRQTEIRTTVHICPLRKCHQHQNLEDATMFTSSVDASGPSWLSVWGVQMRRSDAISDHSEMLHGEKTENGKITLTSHSNAGFNNHPRRNTMSVTQNLLRYPLPEAIHDLLMSG
jgi:hypothetical protein